MIKLDNIDSKLAPSQIPDDLGYPVFDSFTIFGFLYDWKSPYSIPDAMELSIKNDLRKKAKSFSKYDISSFVEMAINKTTDIRKLIYTTMHLTGYTWSEYTIGEALIDELFEKYDSPERGNYVLDDVKIYNNPSVVYMISVIINEFRNIYQLLPDKNTITVPDWSPLGISILPPSKLAESEQPKAYSYHNEDLSNILKTPLAIGISNTTNDNDVIGEYTFKTTLGELRKDHQFLSMDVGLNDQPLQPGDIVYITIDPDNENYKCSSNIAATYYMCKNSEPTITHDVNCKEYPTITDINTSDNIKKISQDVLDKYITSDTLNSTEWNKKFYNKFPEQMKFNDIDSGLNIDISNFIDDLNRTPSVPDAEFDYNYAVVDALSTPLNESDIEQLREVGPSISFMKKNNMEPGKVLYGSKIPLYGAEDIVKTFKDANIFSFLPCKQGKLNPSYTILMNLPKELSRRIYLSWIETLGYDTIGTKDTGLAKLANMLFNNYKNAIYHYYGIRFLFHTANIIGSSKFYNDGDNIVDRAFKLISLFLFTGEAEINWLTKIEKGLCHLTPGPSSSHYKILKSYRNIYIDAMLDINTPKKLITYGHGPSNLIGCISILPIVINYLGVSYKWVNNNFSDMTEFNSFWKHAEENNLFIPPLSIFGNIPLTDYFESPLVWAPIYIQRLKHELYYNGSIISLSKETQQNVISWYLDNITHGWIIGKHRNADGTLNYTEINKSLKAEGMKQYQNEEGYIKNIKRVIDSFREAYNPSTIIKHIKAAIEVVDPFEIDIDPEKYNDWWNKFFSYPEDFKV